MTPAQALTAPKPISLSPQQRRNEFAKCELDPAYFASNYGIIDDVQGDGSGSGTMKFDLWPAQVKVMDILVQKKQVIFVKARQLGISWITCAYALWTCLFQPNQFVLIFSIGKVEAKEMARRIQKLYERLPGWLKDMLPQQTKDNTQELEWANESRVEAKASTPDSGSGVTASLVILDEFAKNPNADSLYAAVKPTIDGGGKLIIVSTAKGEGNPFHEIWLKTQAGENSFTGIFLPWTARPGRDQAWYDRVLSDQKDPDIMLQEYPLCWESAFLGSGRPRFHSSWIALQEPNITQPMADEALPLELSGLPGLLLYRLPLPGRAYVAGADIVEGKEKETDTHDFHAVTVLDKLTGEEMASLHGQWEPDTLAYYSMVLFEYFNKAHVLPERNNHGHAYILALQQLGYGSRIIRGTDKRPGWVTTQRSKIYLGDVLAEALRDETVTVRSREALSQMRLFRVNKNGSTSAPPGKHDDFCISFGLALVAANRPSSDTRAPLPRAAEYGGARPTPNFNLRGSRVSVRPTGRRVSANRLPRRALAGRKEI